MRRRWWRSMTILAGSAVIVTGVLTGPAAQAKDSLIVNNGSGKCLAVPNAAIGAVAIQNFCSSGDSLEIWTLVPVCTQFGCNDQYLIKNFATTRCLETATNSVPTEVVQEVCSTGGGNLSQVWKQIPSSGSVFELENDGDSADMHPQSNSNNAGTPIYVNFATSNSHYLWHLV